MYVSAKIFLQNQNNCIIFAKKSKTVNTMEPMTDTMAAEPTQKLSRTARWAMAHPFMIYEVTDPELRSLLCYYRNKDKKVQQEQTQNQEACYEETNA